MIYTNNGFLCVTFNCESLCLIVICIDSFHSFYRGYFKGLWEITISSNLGLSEGERYQKPGCFWYDLYWNYTEMHSQVLTLLAG